MYTTITFLEFSVKNLVTYILTIGVIVSGFLAYIKNKHIFSTIAGILSIIAAIMFFMTNKMCVTDISPISLEFGAAISAVSLLVAAGVIVVKKITKK